MNLTRIEAAILAALKPGELVSNDAIWRAVWDDFDPPQPARVKVGIHRIRAKLPPGVRIETVHGRGYRLISPHGARRCPLCGAEVT